MKQSTLQVEQFWAEMRSTAYLFSKSTIPTGYQATRLVEELGDILGKRITTYPPVLRELGIGENTSYRHKKLLLGLDMDVDRQEISDNERKFMTHMINKAAQAQKANWTWRITQEAQDKQEKGWYPFFVTLTVDPKMCRGQTHTIKGREVSYDNPEQLWKEGREFRLYIRELAKIVCRLMEHPYPHKEAKNFKGSGIDYTYRPESDYVTYAGVLEHGKTNEHHHMHLMVWMREIPSAWKQCPNAGRLPSHRTERENRHMRYLWPWAIASQKPALYYRTKGDIWSRLGHVTPLDKKTGQSIKINSVEAVGNYVTKYMQKGTKVWHHRMKCTRRLGLQKLQTLINSLSKNQLTPLTWKPQHSSHLHSVSLIHSVPQGLIRSLARHRLFSIQWTEKQLELENLMKTNYDHYSQMLKSVRDGARPDRMHSAEFYDWVQQFLPAEKEYSRQKLEHSHRLLEEQFPRPKIRVQPVLLPGNDSGFTQCI